jgi:hypothetical protein
MNRFKIPFFKKKVENLEVLNENNINTEKWEHFKYIGKLAWGISEYDSKKRDDALFAVRKYTSLSVIGGLIPVPYLDVAAITALQLQMIYEISKIYNVEFIKDKNKLTISALMLGLPQAVSQGFFNGILATSPLVKFIPGAGTFVGEVVMATWGATATYAMGIIFIDHFESGGTILDFDLKSANESFNQELYNINEIWNEKTKSIKSKFNIFKKE